MRCPLPHEIENMFYMGDAPWHKLGVKVETAPTMEQAVKLAGLDWNVSLVPLLTADTGKLVTHQAVQRDSDQSILGVVGPDYKPLQNTEAFKFFDVFLQSKECTLETAGSLREGKRVWIMTKLNRPDSVIVPQADDKVTKYLLLSNSHDGTLAIRVGFTPVRVVCANTLAMAHGSGSSQLLKVRHRGNVVETLERIKEIINVANQRFEATADQYRLLASKQINQAELEKYVKVVFAQKSILQTAEQEAGLVIPKEENTSRILNKIQPLFEHGKGNDLPGVAGTMWAAYNAVTEYIQYERGHSTTTEANRFDSTLFGTGQTLNKKALETAVDLVAA
jgi:phage/plasmid-like protein (TIGR03299 family)